MALHHELHAHRPRVHFLGGRPLAVEIPLSLAPGWSLWIEPGRAWSLEPGPDFLDEGIVWARDFEELDRLRSLYDLDALAAAAAGLLELELVPACELQAKELGNA